MNANLSAKFWLRLHVGLTAAWIVLVAPTLIWWRNSVLWVALMSLWANIAAHASAAQAARAERASENGTGEAGNGGGGS